MLQEFWKKLKMNYFKKKVNVKFQQRLKKKLNKNWGEAVKNHKTC